MDRLALRKLPVLLLFILLGCASTAPDPAAIASTTEAAHLIAGQPTDYDALLASIGDSTLVFLGESTHGTREFYNERARITRRLIAEKQFSAVVLEGDWADVTRVDAYIRGVSDDRTAYESLGSFERFPRWMWRNEEFSRFIEELRKHNDSLPPDAPKVRIYGMDLFGEEKSARFLADSPPDESEEGRFAVEQNRRVVNNAAEYNRELVRRQKSTWNIRDRHMVEILAAIRRHLQSSGAGRIVVWAHNTHVGDARATARGDIGEWSVGQLARHYWPEETYLVGFITDRGTVLAADAWGAEARVRSLRPSMRGSNGAVLHAFGLPAFYLLREESGMSRFGSPRPQRAVGVVYLPWREFEAHYIASTLAAQFDAVVHLDETTALTPLDD
ncbi:MAG TPA: erythromycin esterase family protein [Thermoanaerobaculia bacterium]